MAHCGLAEDVDAVICMSQCIKGIQANGETDLYEGD